MQTETDPLVSAVENLERELAQQPDADWARRLDRVLADVKRAVQQRNADLKSCGGQLVDVDRPLLPSPTTDRHANELRHELDGALEEVAALRAQAGDTLPDHAEFRRRAERLLAALRSFGQQEGAMIAEAMNLDIGGGE